MSKRDYYKVLGIDKDASSDGITLALRSEYGIIRALPPALVETLGGVLV